MGSCFCLPITDLMVMSFGKTMALPLGSGSISSMVKDINPNLGEAREQVIRLI
jgi:hypothetical protein